MTSIRFCDSTVHAERLASTLVLVAAAMPALRKDATNPHFNSEYISLDAMLDTVRGVCVQHNLALSFGAALTDTGRVAYITVTTRVTDASGAWAEVDVPIPVAKMDPQGAGGCITYGKRYGVQCLFAIAAEEDDDGNVASGKDYVKPIAKGYSPVSRTPIPARVPAPAHAPAPRPSLSSGPTLPFGSTKGTPLVDLATKDLESALQWARSKDKYSEFQASATAELESRRETGEDGLPF